ncbi:MAG TPA: alkaline phosphatase PhoX [Candidatus Acidoferrales bacterium]|nr:alkaline phosphatase PhoX [Candidatus Acidoferrales bacterium]
MRCRPIPALLGLGLIMSGNAPAADFGELTQKQLETSTVRLFGFTKPLSASATQPSGFARAPGQAATDQILLAQGLQVRYLTRTAAHNTDQMAFWPNDTAPTHLITCVEEFERQVIGKFPNGTTDKYNPSVQRIRLSDGNVETILRGMAGCDGVRRTPWGTILVTEEASDGQAYEILNPLQMTNLTLTGRGTANLFDPTGANVTDTANKLALRSALPKMAWEGLAITAQGVVIAGDELRPGSYTDARTSTKDTDGGALFKFVPTTPTTTSSIANLNQSPLAAGSVYALQVSCVDNKQQFGQGCEVGQAAWVAVTAANARVDANHAGATGYYRPEDLHDDPGYQGEGLRFCWTNTENAAAENYGEVMCAIDRAPLTASATNRTVTINRFVEGDPDFNQPDNLAFQPGTRNVYVIEDNPNGDIWACLADGADRDIKTDGCVKMLSVVDASAEPTGFLFSGDGRTAYVSIQHSRDPADGSMDVDGYGTDDVLMITGFKPVRP